MNTRQKRLLQVFKEENANISGNLWETIHSDRIDVTNDIRSLKRILAEQEQKEKDLIIIEASDAAQEAYSQRVSIGVPRPDLVVTTGGEPTMKVFCSKEVKEKLK